MKGTRSVRSVVRDLIFFLCLFACMAVALLFVWSLSFCVGGGFRLCIFAVVGGGILAFLLLACFSFPSSLIPSSCGSRFSFHLFLILTFTVCNY